MTVDFQSVNYQADLKLIEFTKKRIAKLEQFYDRIVSVEIFTKVENRSDRSNKQVELKKSKFQATILWSKNMQKFRRSD